MSLIRLLFAGVLTITCVSFAAAQDSEVDDLIRRAAETALRRKSTTLPVVDIPTKRKFNHKIKIKTQYDKFDDTTNVQMMHTLLYHQRRQKIYMAAGFTYMGSIPSRPRIVTLAFNSTASEWQYLRRRVITILADGRKVGPVEMELLHTRIESGGLVTEVVSVDVPTDVFLFLVSASDVQIQLSGFGSAEFSLHYEQLEALRDFASRMQ